MAKRVEFKDWGRSKRIKDWMFLPDLTAARSGVKENSKAHQIAIGRTTGRT